MYVILNRCAYLETKNIKKLKKKCSYELVYTTEIYKIWMKREIVVIKSSNTYY